jgi:hypothetical protein
MPTPTPAVRAALDSYIEALAMVADGVTLDDFRTQQILQSAKTAKRVRVYIVLATLLFMALAFGTIFYAQNPDLSTKGGTLQRYDMSVAALWALALGGLGAVASIFLHVLKLMPQETFRASDEFEIVGRLLLGCLFSTILAMTLAAPQIAGFFKALRANDPIDGGVILLLPFLAGYSIPLVLRLLEKVIRAVELTIGLDDRRELARPRGRRK